jgi:hypothetical protein
MGQAVSGEALAFDEWLATVVDGMKRMSTDPEYHSKIDAMANMEASMKETERLTDETEVLGVPVKEWNKAFVGSFEESLAEVKQRVDLVQGEVSPNLPAKASVICRE